MRRLGIALLASTAFGAAINPQVCNFSLGESCSVQTVGGRVKKVTLLAYSEKTEPYYEWSKDAYGEAVVSAEVRLDVDGRRATLSAGPYRMPAQVNGLWLLVACTKGWTGGLASDPLTKDVRLEVQDAARPFYAPDRFVYPMRDYRWRASNYQHSYLASAPAQPQIYYHRGEDMGMIQGLMPVYSMTAGTVRRAPGPSGDGNSNAVEIEDGTGLIFRYLHMDATDVRQDLRAGMRVEAGEKLGLSGITYQGRQMTTPHLHLDIQDGAAYRHSFPIIVGAYFRTFPGSVLPIAGGWRYVWPGQIELDASYSLPSPGRRIVRYEWTFWDGTKARGPRVKRRYPNPGTYTEQLQVWDDRGTTDLDFVEISVLDRRQRVRPPNGTIFYYPVRNIKPGDEVRFLIGHSRMKDVSVDFGDGTMTPAAREMRHVWTKSGTYVVIVRGEDSGSGPGVFKARVIVD